MKKTNMLNSEISALVASMGHTDSMCIADAGLPIPGESSRIDLALRPGQPAFLDVLVTVLEELVVEKVILAEEIEKQNPNVLEKVKDLLGAVPIEFVSHEEFKNRTAKCRAVVRSGECTPYANIILFSGVPF